MLKVTALELLAPVTTVTVAVPADARSLAGIAACSIVSLTKVVGRLLPFHSTIEPATKLEPVTFSVKANPPAGAACGLNELITGVIASVTLSTAEAKFPATSIACTVIVLEPGIRVTEQLNVPFCTVAGALSQRTAATTERPSDTTPVTAREEEAKVAPFAGE